MTNRRRNNNRRRRRMNTTMPMSPATLPIVVYKNLPDMPVDTVQQTAFTVSDFITSDAGYTYTLEHICFEVVAPSQIVSGPNWTAVDSLLFQVFGYMKQDELLQRNPMTTWRQVDKRTSRFTFNRKYIVQHIYVGGKVPITNINADAIFGCHAVWSSGSAAELESSMSMRLTVKVRCIFKLGQDLTLAKISSSGERSVMGGFTTPDIHEMTAPDQPALRS